MEASPVQKKKKKPMANELKQEIGGGKFQQGLGGGGVLEKSQVQEIYSKLWRRQ